MDQLVEKKSWILSRSARWVIFYQSFRFCCLFWSYKHIKSKFSI